MIFNLNNCLKIKNLFINLSNVGKNNVKLEIEEFTYLNISVLGLNGQQYYQERKDVFFGTFDKQLDAGSWAAGVYIVSVETNKGRLFEKVLVR